MSVKYYDRKFLVSEMCGQLQCFFVYPSDGVPRRYLDARSLRHDGVLLFQLGMNNHVFSLSINTISHVGKAFDRITFYPLKEYGNLEFSSTSTVRSTLRHYRQKHMTLYKGVIQLRLRRDYHGCLHVQLYA